MSNFFLKQQVVTSFNKLQDSLRHNYRLKGVGNVIPDSEEPLIIVFSGQPDEIKDLFKEQNSLGDTDLCQPNSLHLKGIRPTAITQTSSDQNQAKAQRKARGQKLARANKQDRGQSQNINPGLATGINKPFYSLTLEMDNDFGEADWQGLVERLSVSSNQDQDLTELEDDLSLYYPIEQDKIELFVIASLAWARLVFSQGLISEVLHMDEQKPHIHLITTYDGYHLTPKGKTLYQGPRNQMGFTFSY
ncbi:MAG: plasmid recombination protein, partial [Deltaproteobacteria bacterium]|nr:plasmid recombination protein [Deltaproteobacteria bacterium]